MFKINEIVISNTTPLTTNVIWVKPVSFGLYKLLVYTDSGWTSVSPDESKQALINASTEYNTLHSVETLTLQQAVNKVPETDKGLGKMITYFDGTNWQFRQYAGTTLSGWNTVGNWVTVSSSTIDYTGFPLYNITTAIPLTAGQYYTATTARAAVPINVRKRGLELLYETSAGVWYSERFIGTSVADWTIVNNWEAVLSKTYIDTQDALKIDKTSITSNFGNDETKVISQKGYTDDIAAWLPSAVYTDRVNADSGSIKGKQTLFDSYKTALDLLPNTLLAYSPELGLKQSVSGLIYKATKLYNLSSNNNDATQATAANQPYIGGNVAPNEKLWLWGLSKTIPFTPITFNATNKWSVSIVADIVGSSSDIIGSTNTRIAYNATTSDSLYFKNESGTAVSLIIPKFGGTRRIYFVAQGNGNIQVWINGFLQGSISNPSNVTFNTLFTSLNAKVKSVRVLNKDLSKSEIEGLDKFLASVYPEHETTAIGSQGWVTSNHLGNVTSDGFVIPEVQGNDAASNPELLANGNFEGGLVGIMDNSVGGATATYTLNTTSPISGSQDGRLQVTSVGINPNSPRLEFGSVTAGKTYKFAFDYKVNNGLAVINLLSISGITVVNKTLTGSGIFQFYFLATASGRVPIYFNGTNLFDLQIDNISIKECGWADSQAIYDYYISVGKSVLEATKAAAMFCKYNNSDDNAVIYGYLYNWWAVYLFSLYPPKGLRVPTKADFDQLVATLGGSSVAGGKMKKEGLSYWNSPNAGATNESGFSAIAGGRRDDVGGSNYMGTYAYIWATDSVNTANAANIYAEATSGNIVSTNSPKKRGYSLRFLKNAPMGNETQELDTGIFTTDIVTAQKELTMSFGHKVVEVKVNSLTNNLTNFKVELRNNAGVFIQNIVQGISITANTPVDIPIVITQPILFQDAKLWITATGNTGANNLGMQVKILTKQIMY